MDFLRYCKGRFFLSEERVQRGQSVMCRLCGRRDVEGEEVRVDRYGWYMCVGGCKMCVYNRGVGVVVCWPLTTLGGRVFVPRAAWEFLRLGGSEWAESLSISVAYNWLHDDSQTHIILSHDIIV